MMRYFFTGLILMLALAGCATTGTQIREVNRPLATIRSIVAKVTPGGVNRVSENRREYFSNYFPPNGPYKRDASRAKERAYSQILILGDRRPYNIEVRVYRERKQGSTYVRAGKNKKLAQDLARKIRKELADRRDDRNLFDDFRVF